ncbi:DUF4932 domain-containing protein [Mucilaginibacter achroorhodeus]|uniref:DUF4932 domain-containing protein n=1 Tax=Mucilaginibacter achroorhodeus TaxID=2599294 RepID=A0A563U635_9SPHI|nr:DUF4932 domain-containing protein [Mucilaginibacter achroorhodeus]TWR26811.1 DUF4932 domain-containing protein [Mucilaginibacter achroorhodeus]
MIKTFTLSLIFLSLLFTKSVIAIDRPVVDQRVELLSIIFRLAGNKEFNQDENLDYVKAIHKHFDSYSEHPMIKFARELHDSSGISYDAVMAMAVHLSYPPQIMLNVPFYPTELNNRWSAENAKKFISLLRGFYADSDCSSFFSEQKGRYAYAESQFTKLFRKIDFQWFNTFYGGRSAEEFKVIIGLANGGGSYGPHLQLSKSERQVFAIIGAATFDETGKPTFDDTFYVNTIIHEFNHSFVNDLTATFRKDLSNSGQLIFEKQKTKMVNLAYKDWETMYNEAMVRAAVVIYLKDHNLAQQEIDREIKSQMALGFIWIQQLIDQLQNYRSKRERYEVLEQYMPSLVAFYRTLDSDLEQLQKDYFANCARVIAVSPFPNSRQVVDPGITEISFDFDKSLDGVRYFFGAGPKGRAHYPIPEKFIFSNGNRRLTMKVKLQPNTDYQIYMSGSRMRTKDGFCVLDYQLDFITGESGVRSK